MFNRTHWSAVGAAVAVVITGGLAIPSAGAIVSSGTRQVFIPITPCRLLDTRPDAVNGGPRNTPIGGAETYVQQVVGTNGNCTIPADAAAVAMNVTVVNGSTSSFLTVWPSDATRPLASSVNWGSSAPVANNVDVGLSATGSIGLFNNGGSVDVLADIVGYYADHNHDDRYYTKAQTDAAVATADDSLRTDAYSPFALQTFNPGQNFLPTAGSCVYSSNNSYIIFTVPIVVPVGARLISVDVATYDSAGTAIGIELDRIALSPTGAGSSILATGGGGSGPPALDRDVLTPAVTEIVALGESFYVQLSNLINQNGFCGLWVTYDTDG